jgi:sugar/nucleoside kinase (ribokinase family)
VVVCWFAGLTTLDVVHRAETTPRRNQKVTASRQDVAAGGPAANAAVTAAALGVRAVLVTALGQGPVAAAARADLEAHGVEILDTAAPDFPLAVSAVLVDGATGERRVVSPDGALATAPAPSPDSLALLPRPDAVLLDGHHPRIARAVLAYVTTAEPRPRLVLDAGRYRPVFEELLPHTDVAALSDDFAFPDEPDTATAALTRGAAAVVVTHGADPVEWHTAAGLPPRAGTTPVPAVEPRDTLGAGDAFHGALTAAVARGLALRAAIDHAVGIASTRVSVVGPRAWLSLIP